jgi:hypothetical protein
MDAPSYRESVRCRASLAGQGALTCPRPVRLSIVVTCTRSQGSKSLSCFPSMALSARRLPSLLRVPVSPVPRSQRYYEGATTSHPRIHGRLLVRFHSPRDPPSFVSAVALPKGRRPLSGQAPLLCRVPNSGVLARGRDWDLSGLQAIRPVPLLRSRTPVEPTCPCLLRSRRCCPRYPDGEGLGNG